MERQRADIPIAGSRFWWGVTTLAAAGLIMYGLPLLSKSSKDHSSSRGSAALGILSQIPSMPSALDFRPFSLPSFLEVVPNCENVTGNSGQTVSIPVITVFGRVPVKANEIYWLVLKEHNSRDYLVMDRSRKGPYWLISAKYSAFAVSNFTERPLNRKLYFKEGKGYRFEISRGSLSSRQTPLLNKDYVKKSELIVVQCVRPR